MKIHVKIIQILIFLILIFHPVLALENDDDFYIKIPRFSSPPKIDGKLENPVWEKAVILDNFTQYEPQEGANPSEKTLAYIGYDEKNIYIAVRCFDSKPDAIRASLTQRDKVRGDDEVTIYLDTFNDKKRAFAFQINPCGVQSDGIFIESGGGGRGHRGGGFDRIDTNWDTFFITDAQIDDKGYTVEISIPFKSLRFPNVVPQKWGLQIKRNIRRKNEEIYWHPRSRDVNGFLVQSGVLEIDGSIEKGKNFEIMPVLTGLKQSDEKFDPEPGIYLKYGITSDLTSDITFNPDFSQIEADMPQIDVNQRYELYYPEKRPFFLEGKDIFYTPFEMVYTRKIVNPQWGGKLTGKIGKTTLGFLSAFDDNAPEIEIHYESESEETQSYKALVNIFRLKRDIFSESFIGFILIDKEQGNSWNSITGDYNRVAGIDGHFKFLNNYRFTFQIASSQSKVKEEKTNFVPATSFNITRSARHLNFSIDWRSIPEDFEAATGFFQRKDIKSLSTRVQYAFLPQKDIIVDIRPSIEYRRIYDFNNTLTDESVNLSTFMSGWRGTHLWATLSSSMERYNCINFHKKNFRASLGSAPFSWLDGNVSFSFGDGIYYSDTPYLGYETSRGLRLTLKPLTNLHIFYNYENDAFTKGRGGEEVYTINIISQRISYQISRTLSLRMITDYNDYYKKLYNSILFAYELRPGTVFYFGIDDNQEKDDSGIFRNGGRYYFIKFSYWWRI